MKKKKKKLKKDRCIFILISVFVLILILGGIGIMKKTKLTNRQSGNDLSGKRSEEEENINKENATSTSKKLEPAPKNAIEFENLADGEYLTEKGYTLTIKGRIATIENHVIANKTYKLPEDYQPENPYQKITSERCNNCIDKTAYEKFKLMQSDASALGLNIYIASGYRSYKYQVNLYNNYVATSGVIGADTYSSRPGYSEHQTGLCFDLNSIDDTFADTDEGKWVHENAYRYGFTIRFPKGKEKYTGYQYESWHLRYVGEDLATKLYNKGEYLSLEEYYGITSSYE